MTDGAIPVNGTNPAKVLHTKIAHTDDGIVHDEVVHVANFPMTAFGEILVGELSPEVQIRFPYNLNPRQSVARHSSALSTDAVTNGVFSMTAAAVASSFSSMKSRDNLHYHPGIGALKRGTCCFTEGIADSWQMFGFGNDEEGFNFGYDETTF